MHIIHGKTAVGVWLRKRAHLIEIDGLTALRANEGTRYWKPLLIRSCVSVLAVWTKKLSGKWTKTEFIELPLATTLGTCAGLHIPKFIIATTTAHQLASATRRTLADGMFSCSRYFTTVRRASGMPLSFNAREIA